MEDPEAYRPYIERYASYGYARLFWKLGDFDLAGDALEKGFTEGYSRWLAAPIKTRESAAFVAGMLDGSGGGVSLPPAPSPSFVAQSQKLQALGGAVDLLRSFPDEEQTAIFLQHVEEVPTDRILGLLDKDPHWFSTVQARLKERLDGWNPPLATPEEPGQFFARALRQHRLSAQFASTVLQHLGPWKPDLSGLPRFAGWALLICIPLFLFPELSSGYWRYDYNGDTYRSLLSDLLLHTMPLDFILTLAALLHHRYLSLHAPPPLARAHAGRLTPLLGLAGMSGVGLLICEILIALNPEAVRGLTRPPWLPIHLLWSFSAIGMVSAGAYQVALYYMKKSDAADRGAAS
jgi:hypothetical protein